MPVGRSNRSSRTGKRKGSEAAKSGKQKRLQLAARRKEAADQAAAKKAARQRDSERLAKAKADKDKTLAPVNPANLKPFNSYGVPEFIARGYYRDEPFRCEACGIDQVWTAAQQKWWYEVAKGAIYSRAKYCRACRRKRRPIQGQPVQRAQLGKSSKKKIGGK